MIEEPVQEKRPTFIPQRLNLIFVLVFLFFAMLILRLAIVQLVFGERYLQDSMVNSTKKIPVSAPRGQIFDRNGEPLVWNKPVFTATYLPPDKSINEKALAERLAPLLDMDSAEIYKAMKAPQPSYIPRKIKVNIDQKQMMQLAERRTELPGVEVIVESIRQIKGSDENPTGTHIFGYVNSISPTNVREYEAKGYQPSDQIGVLGLEKTYERQLKGKDGEIEIKINHQAELLERHLASPPVPGKDLYLTIDWSFQEQVEAILEQEIERIHQLNPNVSEATAVAMNPQTGEILAFANYPNYDLNHHYHSDFGKIYNEKVRGKELNRIINSAYPMGSTMKPLSEMLAMDQKLVSPSEKLFCGGSLRVGNRTIYCWKRSGHGWVDAQEALQVSCNVYQYELALRLAEYPQKPTAYLDKFSVLDYYFSQFGLGTKTGIDLPGESVGWKTNTFFLGNLAYALIGQYNAYTPMQILQYISTIANDGYRMQPYLVKEVRHSHLSEDDGSNILLKKEPKVLNRVQISEEFIRVVQQGMKRVTEPGGTSYFAYKDFPIPVAAKTGTAQTGSDSDNSLIAGYAPYDDPQIAFVVIVPKGGHGSDASGPISRKILEAFFYEEMEKRNDKNAKQ